MFGALVTTRSLEHALSTQRGLASSFNLTCRPPTSCWTTWFISCSGASHLLMHALTASADILLLSLHLAIHRYATLDTIGFNDGVVRGG